MAEVTLIGPRRLNIGGVLYTRGHPVEVSDDLALNLEDDARFRVKGLRLDPEERRERAAARDSRPMGDSLLRAINDAVADLDVDDDDAFDRHGKPSVRSISALLGYTVTTQERDRALAQAQGRGQLETVSGEQQAIDGAQRSKLRLSAEQREALAKKAAAVQVQLPDGNDKAVERARTEGESEEVLEM